MLMKLCFIIKIRLYSNFLQQFLVVSVHWGGEFIKSKERKRFPGWQGTKVDCWWQTRDTWNRSHHAGTWICPYKIKKLNRENLSLLPLKKALPSILAGLHQDVMSSHPNLSDSCCQGLGALAETPVGVEVVCAPRCNSVASNTTVFK